MKFIQLECTLSPLDENGEKIFNLTVGEEYDCYQDGEDFYVTGDDGRQNNFFDITRIFKEVN